MDEVRQKFLGLTQTQLNSFLAVLERVEGKGARDHAERSYGSWKLGVTTMASKTEERILKLVPLVLTKADKMELVEKAWDFWTMKRRARLWIEVAPTATFRDVFERVDQVYRQFKAQRFTSEDFATLTWLFHSDSEALKETLTVAESADTAIILEAIMARTEEIKSAAQRTGVDSSFVSTLQFEFPFAILTLRITNKPSARAVGLLTPMNEPSNSDTPRPSSPPAKSDNQSLTVQNLDGSIASGALGELISTLPKAEQDRLKAKMAEKLMDLQARQAAGHIDTNNVRKEVNEVLRSTEELERLNARYEIRKDINTDMGRGSIEVKREEIREKTVTIGGKRVDSRCFIATVCYQDLAHPNLVLFRAYRDEVLLRNTTGRLFVKVYYTVGPTAARVVGTFPPLRALCTVVLDEVARRLEAATIR